MNDLVLKSQVVHPQVDGQQDSRPIDTSINHGAGADRSSTGDEKQSTPERVLFTGRLLHPHEIPQDSRGRWGARNP